MNFVGRGCGASPFTSEDEHLVLSLCAMLRALLSVSGRNRWRGDGGRQLVAIRFALGKWQSQSFLHPRLCCCATRHGTERLLPLLRSRSAHERLPPLDHPPGITRLPTCCNAVPRVSTSPTEFRFHQGWMQNETTTRCADCWERSAKGRADLSFRAAYFMPHRSVRHLQLRRPRRLLFHLSTMHTVDSSLLPFTPTMSFFTQRPSTVVLAVVVGTTTVLYAILADQDLIVSLISPNARF